MEEALKEQPGQILGCSPDEVSAKVQNGRDQDENTGAACQGEEEVNLIMPWDSVLHIVRTQLIVTVYYYCLLLSL